MILVNSLLAIISQSDIDKVPKPDLGHDQITTVLKIIFGVGGSLAVLIIVVSGLRFVTSRGDPNNITKARNSIIYAVVGLVVCAMGYAIVTFVIGHLG